MPTYFVPPPDVYAVVVNAYWAAVIAYFGLGFVRRLWG